MKQTVCLIIPPSVFLLDERVFMSLGILRVAAVLERAGHIVEMLDLSGIENYQQAARDHAAATTATVFGITATTPQLPAAMSTAAAIRSAQPQSRVILGGPHVTLVNAARKQELQSGSGGRAVRAFEKLCEHFDVLVAGDGEDAIFYALMPGCPQLVDADDPKSQLFLTSGRLTELPMPARHLLDVSSYRYTIDDVRALSLICQLGCPFGCRFCGGRDSPSLRRVRLRPVENVLSEITHLHDTYGVSGFMLYDDELNVNPKMMELMAGIAQESQRRDGRFRLRGFIKAELFDDAQAGAMYKAGFRWILTGYESGSPRILKNINKIATVEDNTRCIEIARRNGLKVKALMSLGHPGESPETVRETVEWLLEVAPDDFDATILSVYPGSPYYDKSVPHPTDPEVWVYTVNGDRLYSYEVDYTEVADYYKGDPEAGYQSYVYTDYLTRQELAQMRDFVESEVRRRLRIPYPVASPAFQYEHSMGMSGHLPRHILRTTGAAARAASASTGGAHPLTVINTAWAG
jgi:anaerobic magnesium-protoporphyrin IX monomethyl ester cyclase